MNTLTKKHEYKANIDYILHNDEVFGLKWDSLLELLLMNVIRKLRRKLEDQDFSDMQR